MTTRELRTRRRAETNRRNAQHSTGPRTHQRAFHKALAVLLALKKTRRQELGSFRKTRMNPPRIAPSMPSPNKLPPMFSTMVQE